MIHPAPAGDVGVGHGHKVHLGGIQLGAAAVPQKCLLGEPEHILETEIRLHVFIENLDKLIDLGDVFQAHQLLDHGLQQPLLGLDAAQIAVGIAQHLAVFAVVMAVTEYLHGVVAAEKPVALGLVDVKILIGVVVVHVARHIVIDAAHGVHDFTHGLPLHNHLIVRLEAHQLRNFFIEGLDALFSAAVIIINGIDPLEVIDKYGADALRLTLITGNAPGNDMRFYWERVEASRNFANKVWNASRFIMMNLEGVELREPKLDELHAADKWILSRVNTLAKDATENMDKFELGIAVQKVYDFIWDEFCDWYIEIAKVRTYKKDENPESANAALWTLKTVLVNALKLLHPYMPFITEEIFCTLQSDEETIMLSKWPEYKEEWNFPAEEAAIEHCKDLVKGIRNVRTQMDVPPSRKAKLFITSDDEAVRKVFEDNKEVYVNLAFTSEITVQQGKAGIGDDAVSVVIPDAVAYLPLEDLVDFEKEKERLNKEKDKLTKELARSRGMLSNEKFLNNAKPEKVQEEKDKLAKYEQMMAQVEARLAQMK